MTEYKIDYFKILGIGKKSTLQELKRKYKELAKIYHPDKKTGDKKKFKLINFCYLKAKNIIKNNLISFDDIKQNSINYAKNNNPKNYVKMDNKKFNKLFKNNRVEKPEDHGYGDEVIDKKTMPQLSSKISTGDFNNKFKNHKKMHPCKMKNELYFSPKDLISTNLDYTVLGEGVVNDYSSFRKKNLNYYDYSKAYTKYNKMPFIKINERKVENAADIQESRKNINIRKDFKNFLIKEKKEKELFEIERTQRLQQRTDTMIKLNKNLTCSINRR